MSPQAINLKDAREFEFQAQALARLVRKARNFERSTQDPVGRLCASAAADLFRDQLNYAARQAAGHSLQAVGER